jgi:hypothetical protein
MNKFKKLWYKLYYEPIYINKLFHNLKLIGADFPIFPDGSSGNASLLYSILKILYTVNPKNILELGTGQSSYIFNLYCQNNKNTHCVSIESDKAWYNLLSAKLALGNHHFYHIPQVEDFIEVDKIKMKSNFYDLSKIDKKHNFILLDGPFGGVNRLGFINYISSVIDLQDFVLVIDDTNRKMENKIANIIESKLKNEMRVNVESFSVYGSKFQRVIVSQNNSFLRTI